MFVESCIFDLRSKATRSEQMLKNTALYSIHAKNHIYDWKHVPVIGLAQFLLGSNHMEFDKGNNPFKIVFDSKFMWP